MRDRDSERNDAVIDTKLLVSVVLLEIAYLIEPCPMRYEPERRAYFHPEVSLRRGICG